MPWVPPREAFSWLAIAASTERALLVLAVVGAGLLLWRARGRDGATPPRDLGRPDEALAMAVVLLTAALLRLALAGAAHQPRWYFPETSVTVAAADGAGAAWTRWLANARSTQVQWLHESAVMFPVHQALQRLLGPSLELPLYVGALWGVATVALAWAAGRATVSRAFGVTFAALVAVSPLQVTWSRLGGLQVGAGMHVLLVVWLAHVAGARRSAGLAGVAGVLAAASVWHYYAARVAIPLAPIALLSGLAVPGPARGRSWLACLLGMALGFAALSVAVHGEGIVATFWPRYSAYLGDRGETGIADVLTGALENVRHEWAAALRAYFLDGRSSGLAPPPRADAGGGWLATGRGGLAFAATAALGAIGFALSLGRPRRGLVWVGVAVLGLLLPLLSRVTARRLLVFDLGWSACAAAGALAIGGALLRRESAAMRRAVAGVCFAGLATWCALTLVCLDLRLPPWHPTVIPFGEAGFGDGRTCLGCVDSARRWQRDVAGGATVVLLDPDAERENPTCPGGLSLYGAIAALAAGRPEAFVDFYGALQNADRGVAPPAVEEVRPPGLSPVAYLRRRLSGNAVAGIVWEFPNPSQWEIALARRLEAAGGERRVLRRPPLRAALVQARPPGPAPAAFQVRTPAPSVAAAIRALAAFLDLRETRHPCFTLSRRPGITEDGPVIGVLGATAGGADPAWAVASWRYAAIGGVRIDANEPIALAPDPDARAPRLAVLDRSGTQIVRDAAGLRRVQAATPPADIGHACAAGARSGWWVVDAVTGRISGPPPDASGPEGTWSGVALDGDTLVLASAEQEIVVASAADPRVPAIRFPARIGPPFPIRLGDCAPLAVGDGWIATLSALTGHLSLYRRPDGAFLGTVWLPRTVPIDRFGVTAIHGSGARLAVGHANRVEDLEVAVKPGCTIRADGQILPDGSRLPPPAVADPAP